MYQASKYFGDAIAGPNRRFNVRLSANNKVLVESVKSITTTQGAEEITIGSAIASYIQATIEDTGISLSGKEVDLEIGLEVNGEMEYIPMGVYTIQNPVKESNKITFTAYDRLASKCNGAYFSKLTYPTDALNILSEICLMTGIAVDTTGMQTGIMINQRAVIDEGYDEETEEDTVITTYVNPFDGYTYKETIGFIAGLYGRFAVCDRTGKVKFPWYKDISYNIPSSIFYNDLQESEEAFTIGQLTCSNADKTISAGDGATGISMQNPVMTQDILNSVYNNVKDLAYTPAALRFIADPRLDVGDIVTAEKNDGTKIMIPIISLITSYDGGLMQTIASYGSTVEEDDSDTKGPITEMAERVEYELAFVKTLMSQNISATNATIKNLSGDVLNFKTGEFENLKSDIASFKETTTTNLNAANAKIENLEANTVKTSELEAKIANIGYLKANDAKLIYASIKDLEATDAKITTLEASTVKASELEAEVAKFKYLKSYDANLTYATIENLKASNAKIATLESDQATFKKATAESLTAIDADIENIKADYVLVDDLEAKVGTFGYLKANDLEAKVGTFGYLKAADASLTYATITNLKAESGKIESLQSDYATFKTATANDIKAANANIQNLTATKATITDLNAATAKISVLEGNYANLNTLVNGNLTSANIQSLTLNSKNTTIENGMIKNAMIENLAFNKLTGVDINTTNLTVHSSDGKSKWTDNTIQISDANRVRVQIGKDASNDYSMSVWDKNGKLIWDALGATENTIQRKIIRDNVVADNANISGSKLDINSVIKEVNGSTTKLKSSVINMNDKNQTLDVVFNELATTVDEIEVGGRNLVAYSNMEIGSLAPINKNDMVKYRIRLKNTIDVVGGATYMLKPYEFKNYKGIRCGIHTTTSDGTGIKDSGWINLEFGKSYAYTIPNNATKCRIVFSFSKTSTAVTTNGTECHDLLSIDDIKNFKIKLEKGNKATDWTPAPEDTQSQINNITEITTSHTTSISTMQGQISSLISEDTTIKGNYDTLVSKYNSTVETVNSMKTTIGEHTTSINNVSSKITTIEANLSGITTRVSASEEKFDNLEIGGVNLIKNSNFADGINKWNPTGITYAIETDSTYGHHIKFSSSSVGDSNHRLFPGTYDNFKHIMNTTYTLSFYAKASAGTQLQSNVAANKNVKNYSLTTSWQRFIFTYKADAEGSLTFWALEANKDIYLANIKLERGNKATDYTVSPKDTADAIKSVETIATQTENKFSWLVKSGDSASNVTLTDHMYEVIAQNIDLTGKVTFNSFDSAAQKKINDIDTKAGNAQSSATSALTSAKQYTDSAVSGIGDGRNLLWNSNFANKDIKINTNVNSWGFHVRGSNITATIDTSVKHNGFNTLKAVSAANTDQQTSNDMEWYAYGIPHDSTYHQLEEGNYILSFYAKSNVATDFIVRWGYDSYDADTTVALKTDWQKYEIKLHKTAKYFSITIIFKLMKASTVYFSEVKLEKGSSATGYSAAPEDVDNNISTAKSDAISTAASDASNKASQALSDAKSYSSNAVNWVSSNGQKSQNLYSMVSKWTDGAISDTTTINGGWIKTNTITAKQIAIGDFVNYCDMNKWNTYGFTTEDTVDGIWFSKDSSQLIRDNHISEFHECEPGQQFRVEYDLSNTIKEGDTYKYAGIMLFGYDGTKTVKGYLRNAGVTATADGTITHISSMVTMPSGIRFFRVVLQIEGHVPFTGTLKIRNISVRKAVTGNLIVDGAITANSAIIANGAITTAKIADAAITNAKIQSLGAEKITTGQLSADRIDVKGIFAKNVTATGTISGLKITGATGDFSGAITAKSGTIGKYTITDQYLIAGDGETCTGIGGNQAFWAGLRSSNDAPFRVSYSGQLYAKGATLDNATVNGAITTNFLNFNSKGDTKAYFKIATIKITASYVNSDIVFGLNQRDSGYTECKVRFNNSGGTDPTLVAFKKTGSATWAIYKSATSTWDLYLKKAESYDWGRVNKYINPFTTVTVTWSGANADLPSGATVAAQMIADQTVIDGGIITTGIINSDRINTTTLFSKNIKATGTIEGVTLKGATGSFSGEITASSGKIGRYDITSTYLKTGSGSTATGIGGDYAIWAGDDEAKYAPFRLKYDGTLYVENIIASASNLGEEGTVMYMVNDHITIQGTNTSAHIGLDGFDFDFANSRIKNGDQGIELYGDTPFIDFHYGNSSNDYTSRIIANGSNTLSITGNLWADNDIHAGSWLYASEVHSSGAVVIGSDSESYYWAHGYQIGRGTSWGGVCLGDSSQQLRLYGSSIWAAHGISTSDENLKENFTTLDKYEDFYMNLKPIGFNYIGNYDGKKTHFGFGAHRTEDVLESEGYSSDDFAICTKRPLVQEDIESRFGEDVSVNIETEYGISYPEFIALNTHMIQKTRKDLLYQAGKIDIHEAIINDLQFKIAKMEKKIEQLTKALA